MRKKGRLRTKLLTGSTGSQFVPGITARPVDQAAPGAIAAKATNQTDTNSERLT